MKITLIKKAFKVVYGISETQPKILHGDSIFDIAKDGKDKGLDIVFAERNEDFDIVNLDPSQFSQVNQCDRIKKLIAKGQVAQTRKDAKKIFYQIQELKMTI